MFEQNNFRVPETKEIATSFEEKAKEEKSLLQRFRGKAGRAASIFMMASTLTLAAGEYKDVHADHRLDTEGLLWGIISGKFERENAWTANLPPSEEYGRREILKKGFLGNSIFITGCNINSNAKAYTVGTKFYVNASWNIPGGEKIDIPVEISPQKDVQYDFFKVNFDISNVQAEKIFLNINFENSCGGNIKNIFEIDTKNKKFISERQDNSENNPNDELLFPPRDHVWPGKRGYEWIGKKLGHSLTFDVFRDEEYKKMKEEREKRRELQKEADKVTAKELKHYLEVGPLRNLSDEKIKMPELYKVYMNSMIGFQDNSFMIVFDEPNGVRRPNGFSAYYNEVGSKEKKPIIIEDFSKNGFKYKIAVNLDNESNSSELIVTLICGEDATYPDLYPKVIQKYKVNIEKRKWKDYGQEVLQAEGDAEVMRRQQERAEKYRIRQEEIKNENNL